jgi:1,4-dihydroxy-2-naphthoyl-CoA hydrolase
MSDMAFVSPDGTVDLDAVNRSSALAMRLGILFTEVGPERVVATMPVEGNTQPFGLLHGGASVALAETLGSIGAMAGASPGKVPVGIDINATHHRAARAGLVTGVATPLQRGSTVTTWEVVISDESGARICTSRITCLLRATAPG